MREPWAEGVLLALCARCQERRPVYVREPAGLSTYRTHAYCLTCRSITSHEWRREQEHG